MDFLLEDTIKKAQEKASEQVNGDVDALMRCPNCLDENSSEECDCDDGMINKYAYYTDRYMLCDCDAVYFQDEVEAKDGMKLFGYRVTIHMPLGGECHRIIRTACKMCQSVVCHGECVDN